MDCSFPDYYVHGIFQVSVLEWVAIFFSRGFSQPRDRTWVSRIAGRHFTVWATREALFSIVGAPIYIPVISVGVFLEKLLNDAENNKSFWMEETTSF